MRPLRFVLLAVLVAAGARTGAAQGYRPDVPFCVVDGGELRTGLTARYAYEGKWYVVGFCSTPCRTKFLQNPAACMAQALATMANPPKKEKKVGTGPCDLRKVVKVPWCPMCDRELGRDDMRGGVCKKCESKPLQAEFCVKGTSPDDRARVSYKCEACGAAADFESQLKHEPDCKKVSGAIKKICSRSGLAPHSTDTK